MTYGQAMKAARERKGVTRRELADMLGVDYDCIQQHELMDFAPRLDYCIQAADALHISIDEFIGREHIRPRERHTPKEWRELYAMPMSKITALAGVSKRTLINLENGNNVLISTAEAVADAIGLGTDEYLGHEVQ